MTKQIQNLNDTLTQKDIDLLMPNSFDVAQKQTLSKISKAYAAELLNDQEKKTVEDIFKKILSQKKKELCLILVQNLEKAAFVPMDILSMLVEFDNQTAEFVLQKFKSINEKCLKKWIEKKQFLSFIVLHSKLSSAVIESLIKIGEAKVVENLVKNDDLALTDVIYNEILERYADNEDIQKALLMRHRIPVEVLEKLLPYMGDDMKKYLLVRRNLPVQLVTSLVSQTREKSILALSEKSTEDEVRMLAIHLESVDRLTPNLILRSVCVGDMKFFEYALAIKAGIPIRNARILIYDSGDFGLERLYEEADLPASMYPAVQLAVRTFSEMLKETEDGFHDHFTRRMVERLMVLFDQHHIELDPEDAEYFFQKIGQKTWTVCPELT